MSEFFEQRLWTDDEPPGPEWQVVGVYGTIEHNGIRASLGGGHDVMTVVVWMKPGRVEKPKAGGGEG